MTDIVNQPAHYTAGGIECIDALESATKGLEGQEAFCTANAIKYLWRWKRKNGAEDLKKARWYIERLLSTLEPPPAPTVESEDPYGVCETPREPRWSCRNAVAGLAERARADAENERVGAVYEVKGRLADALRPKGYRHQCDGCGLLYTTSPHQEFIDCDSCKQRIRGRWHG